MNLIEISDALQAYINTPTPPLAMGVVPSGDVLPEKVKIPSQHLKNRLTICQAINMARFGGQALALGKKDQSCPVGSFVLGFKAPVNYFTEGNMVAGMYAADKKIGALMEQKLPRFPPGRYDYLLVAPLKRATFTPDFINIYCNPAQLMRLVHAARYNNAATVTSTFTGRGECAHTIVTTIESGECQVVLPGNGERVFAHTQDYEMSFTVPLSKVDDLISGLEGSHKNGIRYPVPFWINYKATFPPNINKVEEYLEDEG